MFWECGDFIKNSWVPWSFCIYKNLMTVTGFYYGGYLYAWHRIPEDSCRLYLSIKYLLAIHCKPSNLLYNPVCLRRVHRGSSKEISGSERRYSFSSIITLTSIFQYSWHTRNWLSTSHLLFSSSSWQPYRKSAIFNAILTGKQTWRS